MAYNVLKQKKFLAAYSECGTIRKAAEFAKVARSDHHRWMQDPEYAQQFAVAHEDAMDRLEEEARRRGCEGWDEPVVYQGGLCYLPDKDGKPTKKPLVIRKYDSGLLQFLLKGGRPEQYRDNWKGEIKHTGTVTQSIDLSKLTDEQFENLSKLYEIANSNQAEYGYVNGLSVGEGTAGEDTNS